MGTFVAFRGRRNKQLIRKTPATVLTTFFGLFFSNMAPERNSETSRKSSKPLMERRRRQRINESLCQLKTLILDSVYRKENTRHSKLEKADILEMTVKYLRNVQRQQIGALGSLDNLAKWRAGFNECFTECQRYLASQPESVDAELRSKVLNHLADFCTTAQKGAAKGDASLRSPSPAATAATPVVAQSVQMQFGPAAAASAPSPTAGDVPTSTTPARLAHLYPVISSHSKSLALLLPHNTALPVGQMISVYGALPTGQQGTLASGQPAPPATYSPPLAEDKCFIRSSSRAGHSGQCQTLSGGPLPIAAAGPDRGLPEAMSGGMWRPW